MGTVDSVYSLWENDIRSVVVSKLTSSTVDRGFEPQE
jgi:hypothetical protein